MAHFGCCTMSFAQFDLLAKTCFADEKNRIAADKNSLTPPFPSHATLTTGSFNFCYCEDRGNKSTCSTLTSDKVRGNLGFCPKDNTPHALGKIVENRVSASRPHSAIT